MNERIEKILNNRNVLRDVEIVDIHSLYEISYLLKNNDTENLFSKLSYKDINGFDLFIKSIEKNIREV